MLGVEICTPISLVDLSEPDDKGKKWTANVNPSDHPVSKFEFNMVIIASGRRVALAFPTAHVEIPSISIEDVISSNLLTYDSYFK